MSGDKIPTVHSLEKPEKLENILRQDRGDDCLPCKVVGQFPALGTRPSGLDISELRASD
jgi:hypothetical protein